MSESRNRSKYVALLFVLASVWTLCAQESSHPATVRVGVIVDSPRARIQDFLPQLRQRIKQIASDKKRNIAAVLLPAGEESALKQAKAANCDYLLQLDVNQLSQLGVALGSPSPDTDRSGNIEGEIVVTYKLQSVKDETIVAEDRRTVQKEEYPLDPNPSVFQTAVSRAVESAASAGMTKLKKKI